MNLETERLLLRPLMLADVEEVVALHHDPEAARFIRRLRRREAEEWVRLAGREWRDRGYGKFAVLEREGGRFVGRVGFKYWPQFDEAEIGWALQRDAWGHGYATEAARACLGWAPDSPLASAPYLTAMIHPDNERSAGVACRLGMAPLREDALLGDPVVVYSLSREDWAGAARDRSPGGR